MSTTDDTDPDLVSITVVVPAFEREALIGRALDSILDQSYRPSEIVVVDDGSSDRTAERAERCGVRVVRQANAGAAAARNLGVSSTSSPWIAFLDSDDTWRPDHLERIAGAIDATCGAAALYFDDTLRVVGSVDDLCSVRSIESEGMASHWERAGFSIDGPFTVRDRPAAWATSRVHPMMVQSSVISRLAFDRVGGFRADLPTREDTQLLLALTIGETVCAVSGVGTVMHEDAAERIGEHGRSHSGRYWDATVVLYEDLSARAANVPSVQKVYRRRLADAELRRAALYARDRRVGRAAGAAVRSIRVDPFSVSRWCSERVSRTRSGGAR